MSRPYHYPRHIRALALDMATKTGYAILEDGKVRGGVFEMKAPKRNRRHLADEHEGKKYGDFLDWLNRIIAKVQPQAIYYEEPFMNMRRPSSIQSGYAWKALLMGTAAQHGIPLHGVAPSSLKKAVTGSGRAEKPEMIAAAKSQFPDLEIVDDNMADALHVLSYGLAAHMGIETLRFGA